MSFSDKIKNFIAPEEPGEELEVTREEAASLSDYEKPANPGISPEANIVLFEPRRFDEAEEIAHHIKSKRACCINLHRMPQEYRTRIVDFLSGVLYGVDGSIKKLSDDVVLCSPKNMQVGGQIDLNDYSND